MATQLRKELAYDAAPEEVAAMLHDLAFRDEVIAAQHVLRGSASAKGSDVTVEQVWSSERLPSMARKFVGAEILIVQEETWGTPTSADVLVTIAGQPGDISGTSSLDPSASGGTVQTVDLSIKVGIPFVAGKLEKMIADLLDKALDKEHRVGQEWLARS